MKLKTHRISRTGDKTAVMATWLDGMKRPADVNLVIERGASVEPNGQLVEGNIKDVAGTLFGLAEIAWGMGWRPRGMAAVMANIVTNYKLPPEEK